MLTVQDIQEKTFERAGKGYNMGQVDEFLDELAADFSALHKENAALKGKLKVLVQKVEEYRETEDSMRLALLSAQKMSAQIEAEAREKADATVAEAQDYANSITKAASDGIANEEAKLEEAKKATDKFFDHMRAVCEKQIEFYDRLSQMRLVGDDPAPAEAPVAEEAVQSSGESAVEEAASSDNSPVDAAEAGTSVDVSAVDVDVPAEEEEPTRLYPAGAPQRKKRSFDDFRFEDEI